MKLLATAALAAAALSAPALAGDVTVTVRGVRPNGGPVLAVLQTADQFAQAQGAYSQKVEPTASTVRVVFRDVAAGTYAAAVSQDTDGDGSVTIGQTGPSEPYGFSGARQKGAPKFAPASKRITARGGAMAVTLKPGAAAPATSPAM